MVMKLIKLTKNLTKLRNDNGLTNREFRKMRQKFQTQKNRLEDELTKINRKALSVCEERIKVNPITLKNEEGYDFFNSLRGSKI